MHATSDNKRTTAPAPTAGGTHDGRGLDQEADVSEAQRRLRAARFEPRGVGRGGRGITTTSTRRPGDGPAGGKSGTLADGVRSMQWTSQALASSHRGARSVAAAAPPGRIPVARQVDDRDARVGFGDRRRGCRRGGRAIVASALPAFNCTEPACAATTPWAKSSPSMARHATRRREAVRAGARDFTQSESDGWDANAMPGRGNLSRLGNVDPGQEDVRPIPPRKAPPRRGDGARRRSRGGRALRGARRRPGPRSASARRSSVRSRCGW